MISSRVERFQRLDHKSLQAHHGQHTEQQKREKQRGQDFKHKYPDNLVDFGNGNNGSQLPLHQRRCIIKCIAFFPIFFEDCNPIDAGIKIFKELGIRRF